MELNESSKTLRIKIKDTQFSETEGKINTLIKRLYEDADFSSYFSANKSDIYKELGINEEQIQLDPNIKVLELIALPEFRNATHRQDFEQLIYIMMDSGLLGKDDFSSLEKKYANFLNDNKSSYKEIFDNNGLANFSKVPNSIEPQACVTCISFAAVAVNIAVATNVVAAVVAAVYAAVSVWGGGGGYQPHSETIGDNNKFGSVALTDRNIATNKNAAMSAAYLAGFNGFENYIYRDLAKTEIKAFYHAAYNVGLIENEETLSLIIESAIAEIDSSIERSTYKSNISR
ncbi:MULTISPECIES: hypothetical protein [Pseudoalteromonas]|uniref:Uncharacterized protein n=1 Tax=Pseudoalteromonas amylolytica TaxID=1859457 RepID=A0A1S1N1G2_9GAMM|nr:MULTISPECIES: hypothetical protein [Pseudoalteromonas]OHU90194.1 hypothetical protein BFC16_04390 [Pseudoalteromonas sp. JW3]OHU92439.1 hypothetical protein BET10_05830 [Pseudoalteromonas amylolytica]